MAMNFGYAGTGAGIIKLVHLVFGLITVICGFVSFDNDNFKDRFFVGGATTILLVSIIYLILHFVSRSLARSGANRLVNVFYHFLGALILIVAASLFLQASVSLNNRYCKNLPLSYDKNGDLCGKFGTKAAAGAFAILNGILYLGAIALTATGSGYDDEDPEIEGYNK